MPRRDPAASSRSSRLNSPNSLGNAPDRNDEGSNAPVSKAEGALPLSPIAPSAREIPLHGQVGRDEPARAVGAAGEVDGGRRALQREDQLTGVGRSRHRLGVERAGGKAVRQVRLGEHQVDGGRLRGQVPHRRHDRRASR